MPRIRPTLATAFALTLLAIGCTGDGTETVTPAPTTTAAVPAGPPVSLELEGPISGGAYDLAYNAMPEGFEARYDYREEEYFVSGTATAFTSPEPLAADGQWDLVPATEADYTTRIMVRQPSDPADFNGIVLVEWNNVTVARDSDPEFGMLHPEIFAEGYAYVGVSAQEVSIEGGEGLFEVPGIPDDTLVALQQWDPERYAPLDHPGDEYSYDLFSQIGALAQGRAADTPFDGLDVHTVLAVGGSQSAFRLVSYIDGVHPLATTFDGFLLQNPGASGAPFGDGPDDAPLAGTRIRTDLQEPVLLFVTETDLALLGYLAARQPDDERIATWEVAGTAHADQATLDYGIASGRRWSDVQVDFRPLCGPANTGPQAEVARAALARLRAWVEDGTSPPPSPRVEVADGASVRNADGNVLGGIRTPDVDAPVATLTGMGSDASVFCLLFGQEIAFSADRLEALYPTHEAYVDAVTASADAALDAGFLLEDDRAAIIEAAEDADIGG